MYDTHGIHQQYVLREKPPKSEGKPPNSRNVGVCVLTPDGTTLQIYDPQWGRCTNVCIFERKLLLCGRGYEGEQAASSSRASPASSILEGELVEVLCGL